MTQVSPECAVAYAMIGGFRGNDIITAVAVAIQESDLKTDNANSCCVGLWQINLKSWNTTAAAMKVPVKNAQMAYKVFTTQGRNSFCNTGSPAKGNCNPWQAYGANQPGRSWKQALQTAATAYASVIAKGIGSDVLSGKQSSDITKILADKGINCIVDDIMSPGLAGVGNPLDAASAFVNGFNRMGAWLTNPDNLMRMVKVGLGFAVILVGGAALMDKEIASITPVGKIAKVLK